MTTPKKHSDLLASVEKSGDEIVRELTASRWNRDLESDDAPTDLERKAAARIVALEAENARLRGHAEVMAYISEEYWNRSANSRAMLDALDRLDAAAVAYRADFPKEKA